MHSPRYVHNMPSTSTTKTVVRIYSCVTLFYTQIIYLSSCAVGFERIFTCTYESFFDGLLLIAHPSEVKSYILNKSARLNFE